MKALFFRHAMMLATDVEEAFEIKAGDTLTGVPDDLAEKLLKRPDVMPGDANAGEQIVAFGEPRRRVADALARIVSPALDENRLAEDEERAAKATEARRKREDRLRKEAAEARKAREPA